MIANTRGSNYRPAVLALGGGGARGLAHFGAVQSVIESGFGVERIVGVSMGSLAGAMCAQEKCLPEVVSQVRRYLASESFAGKQTSLFGVHASRSKTTSGLLAWYDQIKSYLWARHLLGRVFRRPALLGGHVLDEVISELIPDMDISETSIPLSIVAVDLRTGHPIVLERGPLRRALAASAAIPGIFPPVEWDGQLLCDIGVLDSLPTQVAQSYDEGMVIGVDVGPNMERVEDCDSALHVLLRMDELGERLYRRHAHRQADLLIQPEVGHWAWFDFSHPQQLLQAGLEAGRAAIAEWHRAQPQPPPAEVEKWTGAPPATAARATARFPHPPSGN